jgi:pyruvate ferredoxin oxidoreductase beta subunit
LADYTYIGGLTWRYRLKEYIDGKVVHTRVPRERAPVEDYLQLQGRFAHLFQPQRNEAMIAEIQARVDRYWDEVT